MNRHDVRDFPAMAGKWPRYPPELGASTVSSGSVGTFGLKKCSFAQQLLQTFYRVETVSEIHLAHCQCITVSGVSKASGLAVGIQAGAGSCSPCQCCRGTQGPTFSFSSHWQIAITWQREGQGFECVLGPTYSGSTPVWVAERRPSLLR